MGRLRDDTLLLVSYIWLYYQTLVSIAQRSCRHSKSQGSSLFTTSLVLLRTLGKALEASWPSFRHRSSLGFFWRVPALCFRMNGVTRLKRSSGTCTKA